jgi:hypothetical protein
MDLYYRRRLCSLGCQCSAYYCYCMIPIHNIPCSTVEDQVEYIALNDALAALLSTVHYEKDIYHFGAH